MSAANWNPTHKIPASGLPARSEPNAALEPMLRIQTGVEVAVVETLGGWTKIRTDTGWEAWVDGTRLDAMAAAPPAAAPPPAVAPPPPPASPEPAPSPEPEPEPEPAPEPESEPEPAPEPAPEPEPKPAPTASPQAWSGTHLIPDGGLPARAKPDPGLDPLLRIKSDTAVRVVETQGAWSKITIESGWEAWVDNRRLLPIGGAATAAPAAAPQVAATPAPAPAPAPEPEVWKATHTVPEGGLSAWTEPKADRQPILKVKSETAVQVVATAGAWSRIRTEEGWEAWMDGRRLVEIG